MTEKQVIVNPIHVTHKGLFSSKEIERYIDKTLTRQKYWVKKKDHTIVAKPQNKKHSIEIIYAKNTSKYDLSLIVINLGFSHITRTYALIDGQRQACEKGEIDIMLKGVTNSHRQGFLGYTPYRHFFTFIRSKFITQKYDIVVGAGLEEDIKGLFDELYLYIKNTEWVEVKSEEKENGN